MRNSPFALRRRAEEYRSIAAHIGTPEVRESVLHLAEQIDRRANVWASMTEDAQEHERA